MVKKILPFLIVLLILVPVILFIIFFKNKELPDTRIDAIEAVPVDAVFVVESKSVHGLLQLFSSRQHVREDLLLMDVFHPYISGLKQIDSILNTDPGLKGKLDVVPGVFSLHQTGEKKYDPLLILQSGGRIDHRQVNDLIRQLTDADVKHSDKNYSKTRIHHLQSGDQSVMPDLYVCEVKKYLLISPDDLILESAIRQLKDGSNLNQMDDFRKAAAVAGKNSDANLYVNLKRFGGAATRVMSPPISKFIDSYNSYGSWAEIDLNLKDAMLTGSGFGYAGDTLSWLGLFEKESPPRNELDRVLPASTMAVYSYGFQDPGKFMQRMDEFYAGHSEGRKRNQIKSKIVSFLGEDPLSAFAGFLDKEAGVAWIPGEGNKPAPVVIMRVKSQNMAFQKLEDWLLLRARKEGKQLQNYRIDYRLDQEKRQYLYNMPVEDLPELLFGAVFSSVKGKYFAFTQNELIVADDLQTLKDIIYFRELDKTLYTDLVYQSVISQIGMRNNFIFYLAPFRAEGLLNNILNESWAGSLTRNEEFMKRIGAVSLQIQAANTGYFHNFFVRFSESELSGPQTIWESRLDTTINFKPVFITNHDTGKKEILLQDEKNNLYLISTAGRQLFKVALKEAINSEIYQIDYYKNGKLQFLFSSRNMLHLIDRNGNYVDKYPIMLRSEATNGMALFDYDNRKDYRIFIAGKDRGVYVYDKTGAIVKGWDFGKTEGEVNQEVQHIVSGSKDYIVFADQMRVYIVDRRGQERVKPAKQFAKSANNGLILDRQAAKGPRLIGTDVNGMIWSVYFTGAVEEEQTSGYSADHYFIYEDIDSDGRKDYVFADQDRLEVISSTGKQVFREKVGGLITHMPNIYVFPGNSRQIGIVNRNEERIYLFKADGKQHEGFPLRGRTPFSIGYLEPGHAEFNLIVGGDDKFLLNYRVK